METEDDAFVAWMDEQAGAAAFEEQRAYETWREARVTDGDDGSEDAYLEWLDSQLPTD